MLAALLSHLAPRSSTLLTPPGDAGIAPSLKNPPKPAVEKLRKMADSLEKYLAEEILPLQQRLGAEIGKSVDNLIDRVRFLFVGVIRWR